MTIKGHVMPIWYNADSTEHLRIRASSCSVDLSVNDIPKATLTMLSDQEVPDTHAMIELFRNGTSLGKFRVVSYGYTYRQSIVLQLMGMVDVLNDDVYELEAEEEQTKTATAWIQTILGRQSTVRWQLGTCAMTDSIPLKINYQTIWTLLEEIRQYQVGYMWTYDFSTSPWTLNLVQMPSTTDAAFRVTRNIESAKISITDQDLFNKLICTVSNTDGTVTTITKNDTTSQSQYGVRTRCTDIKSDQLPRGMTADQYAQSVLDEHSNPVTSIQISGMDLQRITGDDYDHIVLGSKCAVVLPGYDTSIVERVMSLSYPDILNTPDRLTVQMSTEIKPITGSLAGAKQMASAVKSVRGGGGGGGGKADSEKWSKVLTKTIEAVDGTGISELWQSGIVADATTGTRIFSVYQGMQSMQSEINVHSNEISLVVKNGAIDAASIVLAINRQSGESIVKIGASYIDLDGYLSSYNGWIASLSTNSLHSEGDIEAMDSVKGYELISTGGDIQAGNHTASWQSQYVLTGLGTLRSFTYSGVTLRAFNGTGTTASGTTIYYLGRT